jgi:hypothetical protein
MKMSFPRLVAEQTPLVAVEAVDSLAMVEVKVPLVVVVVVVATAAQVVVVAVVVVLVLVRCWVALSRFVSLSPSS